MTAPRIFLTLDPGKPGDRVLVTVPVNGKPLEVEAVIKDGPNSQGLYHVEMQTESDHYLPGDPVPFYRRELRRLVTG